MPRGRRPPRRRSPCTARPTRRDSISGRLPLAGADRRAGSSATGPRPPAATAPSRSTSAAHSSVADVVPVLGRPADHHDVFERRPHGAHSRTRISRSPRSVTPVGTIQHAAAARRLHHGRQRALGGAPRPAAHRRSHRGRGEPRPPRPRRRAPQHRLAHGVRLLHRELDAPADRGAPHPRPAQEAVRSHRRAQRAQRAGAVDRPTVRLAGGAHPEADPAGDPQGDRRHQRQHRHAAHRRLRLRHPGRAARRRQPPPRRGHAGDAGVDRPPALPPRAAAGRRARAHERRGACLQLPALAVGRRAGVLHRARTGRTSTAPSSTRPWPSSS